MIVRVQKKDLPEKRRKQRRSGIFFRSIRILVQLICHYPLPFFVFGVESIAFGWVAFNALWYQKGPHPSPIFSTRNFQSLRSSAQFYPNVANISGSGITTFKVGKPTKKIKSLFLDSQDRSQSDIQFINELQKELNLYGLYDSPFQGQVDQRTVKAILSFQKAVGIPVDGRTTASLMEALKKNTAVENPMHIRSLDQHLPVTTDSLVVSKDPIATLIKSAENKRGSQEKLQNIHIYTNLVLKIQKGLSNMAYNDIKVNGVVDKETSQAIFNFERHYHLPETGQPNQKVLSKLQKIGAL